MNLNSYLYSEPTVVEWLGQDENMTCKEYQRRAAGRIAAFERAFGGPLGRSELARFGSVKIETVTG